MRSELLGALFLGCAMLAVPVRAEQAPLDWTLMIYMAADNDLEQAALIDLDEIEAGMPATGMEVIVLMDRAKGYADGVGDWTDARVLRMRPNQDQGTLALQELVRLGEINTGAPASLTDFVRFVTTNFPAKHTGLVLWDHGGGWQGMADDLDPAGAGEHDNLSITEVGAALRAALPAGRRLDLIGFDMCLMAQLEMAWEIADVADFMVASQAVEPSYGWPYAVLLPEFGQSARGPRRLAQSVVRRYAEYTDSVNELVATQSAIDLRALGDVNGALNALLVRLDGVLSTDWPVISRSLFWADSFEVSGKAEALKRGTAALASSDLMDILKRMRNAMGQRFPAEQEYQALVRAMDAAVMDSHVSQRHHNSHGLSVYAPPLASAFNADYLKTRFAGASNWPRWLARLHEQQTANKRAPTVRRMAYVKAGTTTPVQEGSMLDNSTLKIEVEGANLLWVSGLVGRYVPEQKGHLIYSNGYLSDSRFLAQKLAAKGSAADLLMPDFKGDVARMEMEVAPMTYAVTNGEVAGFATLDSRALQTGQGRTAGIQVLLESAKEGTHQAVVLFDLVSWRAESVVLLVEQSGGRLVPREVEPAADDMLTLLYDFIPDTGEPQLMKGARMPWKQGLELILDEVPEGDYRSWAIAETLTGDTGSNSATVRVVPPRADIRAGLEGARKLTMAALAGVWADDSGQPAFGIEAETEPGSNLARLLINKDLLAPEIRDFQFLARLDNRLLPSLHLLTVSQDGKRIMGRDTFLLLADPARPDTLWIKTLIGGAGHAVGNIIEVTRTARLDGGVPAPDGGNQPPVTPQAPRNPLVGYWEGQTAVSYLQVEFSAAGEFRQVETAFNNSQRMELWGRYAVQGNQLQLRIEGGQNCAYQGCVPVYPPPMAPFPFDLRGDQLRTPTSQLVRRR
ncbi:MAG: clostripain-related cysteine peptidase [Pseudomonadales bacterium]